MPQFSYLQAKDKSDGSTYYKVSGGLHRREFDEETLETPLSVLLFVNQLQLEGSLDCTEKEGAKGQLRAMCKA